ncbi:hypothetical protein L208DRAFT_1399323 [Tricholoma matsutake]|nr:hypothetical protein L208DRAFT_1399323 [Tricholoma matsutake 945]
MRPWIAFALDVFEKSHKPLVLHTLPVPASLPEVAPVPPQEPQEPQHQAPPRLQPQSGTLSNATTTITRLISVAEIIKREYVKVLQSKRSLRLEGLHQYNEIGCLEDLGSDRGGDKDERTRADEIVQALSGRNHVKQKQTPYMKITLSESPLPELVTKGATYQPPTVRKLGKSAKARAKKRMRKSQVPDDGDGNDVDGEEDMDAEEPEDSSMKSEKGKERARVAVVDKIGS